MSLSPPIRRLSNTSNSSKREEDLINAYEAEEERIINVLSRKLEKLQEEKIDLENALEAESESHVNRLSRELSALRLAQQRSQQANGNSVASVNGTGHDALSQRIITRMTADPAAPSTEMLLESMRRENEQLRNRLVDTEREYIRTTRLNEMYREELIELRNRLGLPVDTLIGLSSTHDPFSQPTHRRRRSSSSRSGIPSPIASHAPIISASTRPTPSVPIPRPPSQIHRPHVPIQDTPPLSGSPSVSSSANDSPFLSPLTGTHPASYLSVGTHATSPPSSGASGAILPSARAAPPLSYPSVPPPSLASSLGSPVQTFHISSSPVEAHASRWAMANGGTRSSSRSAERGFRVAETGSLRTSRRGSVAASALDSPLEATPM